MFNDKCLMSNEQLLYLTSLRRGFIVLKGGLRK